MGKKHNCTDCFNKNNDYIEADFLVLNPPTYPHDIYICRNHLMVMLEAFIDYSTVVKEITIIKLDRIYTPKPKASFKKVITG